MRFIVGAQDSAPLIGWAWASAARRARAGTRARRVVVAQARGRRVCATELFRRAELPLRVAQRPDRGCEDRAGARVAHRARALARRAVARPRRRRIERAA